jgi:DNA invertase Pin-like site-specific DNA recombinase
MIIGFGILSHDGEGRHNDRPALEKMGCERILIVADTIEAKFKLDEILQYTRPGDVLVVLGLDRLGDTLDTIIRTVGKIAELRVGLHVVGSVIPGTPVGDNFVAACDLLARQRHALAHQRSGMTGHARGHRGRGRPGSMSGVEQERAMRMLAEGRATVREVARLFKVSPATIYRLFPRRRLASLGQDTPVAS